jgi:hypothetical protein
MKLLIVAAVAALTAIVVTFVLGRLGGPWDDHSIRTAIVGAVSAIVGVNVSKTLRKAE